MKKHKNHTYEDYYDEIAEYELEDVRRRTRQQEARRPIRNWKRAYIDKQTEIDEHEEFYGR